MPSIGAKKFWEAGSVRDVTPLQCIEAVRDMVLSADSKPRHITIVMSDGENTQYFAAGDCTNSERLGHLEMAKSFVFNALLG